MRDVVELRDQLQAKTADHPFFGWLRAAPVPLERQLDWAPALALFAMFFRDLNRWVLRFPEPRDELEWLINAGTYEDETHSRLFLRDWRALGLDDRLGWRASDTLWWLFLSPDQEAFRRCGMRYLAMAVADGDDPLVRFAHCEAAEATGHVMLDATVPIATKLAAQTGQDLRYFGPYHLDRETGHVGNTHGLFEARVLDEHQRALGLRLCARMFALFNDDVFDGFLAYVRRYVERDEVPSRPPHRGFLTAAGATPTPIDGSLAASNPRQAMVWRALQARRDRAAAHPFFAWLGKADGLTPRERLCRFLPMWTMDVLGYRDLATYAFTYPEPRDDAEHAINRWAAELATHSGLYLGDWDTLALDDRLGLRASDTLELLFLDPDLDLHREHLVEFAKLALAHPEPALRWWLMTVLEATGEAFFACTRPVAVAVEATTGGRLDYLAERHATAAGARAARPQVPPASLPPGGEDAAIGLVDVVFDAFERQLTRSHAIARANKFGI